jgi:protein phosphatase
MNEPSSPPIFEAYGATDVGLVRLNNEDVFAKLTNQNFFILADGMGGHKAGEVAANETVFKLAEWVRHYPLSSSPSTEKLVNDLKEAICQTNEWVHHLASQEKRMEGMGTTLCVAWVYGETLIFAHVGDSRIYRIRKGRITCLTRDHSLRDELLASGELDESQAANFPYKNVITRAIGTQPQVLPEVQTETILPGDLYFLCSDGLTDALADKTILDIIRRTDTFQEATEELILAVKKAGGTDNITILLFKPI